MEVEVWEHPAVKGTLGSLFGMQSKEVTLKIVSFVEGADPPGFVGVPKILAGTASHGHSIVLVTAGDRIFGGEKYEVSGTMSAHGRREGAGSFGIVRLEGWGRWRFNPSILWRFRPLVREADFVTLHSLYSFPVLAGYLFARMYRKPYAFWAHGVLAPFQRTVGAGRKGIYNRILGNRILQNAAVIIYSSEGERQETQILGLRPPSVVIPEGFSAEDFGDLPERGRFRARFINGHSGPLVLFLARVNAKKGVDLLIQTMKRVIAARPDARLAIVGPFDPPAFKGQVVNWIEENGIEANTVLPGLADAKMRLEAFADADVYVLPSYAESFGHSVFEAMASGVPVVVSETLALADRFVSEGAGFAPPRTPEAFAEPILKLLDCPEMRREMGNRGRSLARRYSWNETGAKVSRALKCVLEGRTFPADLFPEVLPESGTRTASRGESTYHAGRGRTGTGKMRPVDNE